MRNGQLAILKLNPLTEILGDIEIDQEGRTVFVTGIRPSLEEPKPVPIVDLTTPGRFTLLDAYAGDRESYEKLPFYDHAKGSVGMVEAHYDRDMTKHDLVIMHVGYHLHKFGITNKEALSPDRDLDEKRIDEMVEIAGGAMRLLDAYESWILLK